MTNPSPPPADIPALVRELLFKYDKPQPNYPFCRDDYAHQLIPLLRALLLAQEQQIAEWREALEHMANMPEYDQDDAHRLRHQAKEALSKYPKES